MKADKSPIIVNDYGKYVELAEQLDARFDDFNWTKILFNRSHLNNGVTIEVMDAVREERDKIASRIVGGEDFKQIWGQIKDHSKWSKG